MNKIKNSVSPSHRLYLKCSVYLCGSCLPYWIILIQNIPIITETPIGSIAQPLSIWNFAPTEHLEMSVFFFFF
jgi:hypothetical protein